MSKEYLKAVFESIKQCPAWSLQILQFSEVDFGGWSYKARLIAIEPEKKLEEYIEKISDHYANAGLKKYESVSDYTGDFVNDGIYKLNDLVKDKLTKLSSVIASPDKETPVQEFDADALLLKGTIREEQQIKSVIMVSMQRPVSFLTNKLRFVKSSMKFHEIDELVLTLRTTIDVMIVGNNVYLMGLAGEKLFNLEDTAKTVCKTKTEEIAECPFFSNSELFKTYAQRGHNPRRFLAYNKKHFEALEDMSTRQRMSEKFGFPLDDDNKILTDNPAAVNNLVKFLCNKGMTDPIDGNPMEVAASKPWRK